MRADLFAVLRAAADRLTGPYGEAARGLITEILADPDATRAAREHPTSAQAPTPQLISLALTLLSHHYLLRGAPIEDRAINEILDQVVMPLIRP